MSLRALTGSSLCIVLLGLGAVGCSNGGSDPIAGNPGSEAVQQLKIGNRVIAFEDLNLLHLGGTKRVTVDFNRPIDFPMFDPSLITRITMVADNSTGIIDPYTGLPAGAVIIDRATMDQKGQLVLDNADLGVVSWVTNDQNLGLSVQAGVRYAVTVETLSAESSHAERNSISVNDEHFTLLPTSLPLDTFDTRLETEGLVNRIKVGDVTLSRDDNTLQLLALSASNEVTVELATNINPGEFASTLGWEVIINNLTTQTSYNFDTGDLLANGVFSFPDPRDNVIVWTKTTGPLDSFIDAQSGGEVEIGSLGDVIEIRIDEASGFLANGDQLKLRDLVFRLLHTFS